MADYSEALARAAGWLPSQLEMIKLAALTHDTGKIGIPHGILKAPRILNDEEWAVMKTHSQIGYDILHRSNNPVFKMAAEIALYHHEKWDGGGYPTGLAGTAIPEAARIVAIADVFDALSSKRPYKEPWGVEDTLSKMQQMAGSHLDPNFLALFIEIMPEILSIKAKWGQLAEGKR